MRRLVAALACRAQGSRLYGKPLQHLDVEEHVTILDHMIRLIKTLPPIQAIVLGISEGDANLPFLEVARQHGVDYIIGDQRDVLHRLVSCGRKAGGTDVFRVTTESPFTYFEAIDEAWRRHVSHGNDVTVVDGLPDGCNFEIFTLEALRRSHERGEDRHRSELCSLYIREHRDEFRVELVGVPSHLQRGDLRLTIDYPEDLVVCRRVYERLADRAPRIPLESIVATLDAEPGLKALVAPFVAPSRLY